MTITLQQCNGIQWHAMKWNLAARVKDSWGSLFFLVYYKSNNHEFGATLGSLFHFDQAAQIQISESKHYHGT